MRNKLLLVFVALFFISLLILKLGNEKQEIIKERKIAVEYNFFSFPVEKEVTFNNRTEKTSDWWTTETMAIVSIIIFFIACAIKRVIWFRRRIKKRRRNPW